MIVEFKNSFKDSSKDIVFCFVDNTWQYNSSWTRELIKNQSDYTITNITQKGYTVLQGLDEDSLLRNACKNYKHAVVFSTGTEFINGIDFFNAIEQECNGNYILKGHILDRGNAYYELHQQCYLINLENYTSLGMPSVGLQTLGEQHTQTLPVRSEDNIHDDYTPLYVLPGVKEKTYQHKMHGWNIISIALKKYKLIAFNDAIRNSKKHYYPEHQKEFLNYSDWIYKRENYCANQFVHTSATDKSNAPLEGIEQVLTPASGNWWAPYITDNCNVVMYDYNTASLDYWKNLNPSYKFVKCDFLCELLDITILDPAKKTLINLSNIYAYEGTTFTHSLEKRLYKENEMIKLIQKYMPQAYISFSARASSGFIDSRLFGVATEFKTYSIRELTAPTWHTNGDWNG